MLLTDKHFSVVTSPINITYQRTDQLLGTTALGAWPGSISSVAMSALLCSARPVYDAILAVTSSIPFLTRVLVGIIMIAFKVSFIISDTSYSLYEGHPINKLLNGVILTVFRI